MRDSLRLARTWPWLLGLSVFLVHLPYLAPGGPWARGLDPLVLGQDEGTLLYDAWRIAQGDTMYRDFFQFQGPTSYYLYAWLYELTGPSIAAARFVHLLIISFTAAMLALVVARFAGRVAGVAAALVHACVLIALWPFVYAHWLAEALVLCALVLLTRQQVTPQAEICAGVLLGLALFTIQSLGIPALVAVLGCASLAGIAARDLRQALLRPARIALGAGAVAAVIFAYFALAGALSDLLYAMFVWPHENYQLGQGHGADVYGFGMETFEKAHARAGWPWRFLGVQALQVIYYLPYVVVVAGPIVAGRALYRMGRRMPGDPHALVVGVALAVVSPLLLGFVRRDITHIAFLDSFALAALAAFAGLCIRGRRHRAWIVTGLFACLGLGSLATYGHKTAVTWDRSRALGDWRHECLALPGARHMDRTLRPEDTIVVGSMAGFYYLHVRDAATPHTYLPARRSGYYSDAQWARIAGAIVERRPAALRLVGDQWRTLVAMRPELATLYRAKSGMWVLAD